MLVFVSMGIRTKLFAGFGLVLALLSGIGFIGWKNTTEFSADFQSLYNDRLVCAIQWDAVQKGLYGLRVGGLTYATADAQARAQIRAQEAQFLKEIDDNVNAYAATYLVDEETQGLNQWRQDYPAYLKARAKTLELADQGDLAGAEA